MGGKNVTQLGLKVVRVDEEKNLLLVKGSVPGPQERVRRGGERVMATNAPKLGSIGHRRSEGRRLQRGLERASRLARRAQRAAVATPGHARGQEPRGRSRAAARSRGARRAPAERARAPRVLRSGARRRRGLRPAAARLRWQGEQEGARQGAARRARRCTPQRGSFAVLADDAFGETPSAKKAAELRTGWAFDGKARRSST